MTDIYINEKELLNLIIQLEKDNKLIVEDIDSIYEIMINIEEKDWKSPVKERLNNKFIPYIKKQSEIANKNLNNKTNLLRIALKTYIDTNNKIKDKVNTIEEL